jgi:hypothetical protein
MQRITIRKTGTKTTKRYVLVAPPWAQPGEVLTMADGSKWTVVKTQEVGDQLIEIKFQNFRARTGDLPKRAAHQRRAATHKENTNDGTL